MSTGFDPLQSYLPITSTWLLFNHFRKLAETQCIATVFFIAGARFSHRLFSAGTFHVEPGGAISHMGLFPIWAFQPPYYGILLVLRSPQC